MRTTYQRSENQLKRQQEILKALGFYNGAIDGIWGPKSIAAMKTFEAKPEFKPAVPNHGLPLGDQGPYPAGITRDFSQSRHAEVLLFHAALEFNKPEPAKLKPVPPKEAPAPEPVAEEKAAEAK